MNNKKSILFFGSHLADSYLLIDEGIIEKYGIKKGESIIYDDSIPAENLEKLGKDFKFTEFEVGGSSVNTAKAYSLLGGKVGLVCSHGGDENGKLVEIMASQLGIEIFPQINSESPTSYLRIMITPDGQRTVVGNFYPSFNIVSSKVDFRQIANYDYSLVECYSLTDDEKNDSVFKTLENVEKFDSKLIVGLSNQLCVSKFRNDIFEFVFHRNCRGIIGNNFEYLTLFPEYSTIKEVVDYLINYNRKHDKWDFLVITNGASGAWLIRGNEIYFSDAPEIDVVDTTGAGDYFAAGALYGMLNGYSLKLAGDLGNILAADVISKLGVTLSYEALERARTLLYE